jgi:hypothetical protein
MNKGHQHHQHYHHQHHHQHQQQHNRCEYGYVTRRIHLSRFWHMTNDGVYLIAYNSLKGDDDKEMELLRSIQKKNHIVDMNRVILNTSTTSTTAFPSSSSTSTTTTTSAHHAVEDGRITLNGVIAIAPYVKKNTSTAAAAATTVAGADSTSMKLQSTHQMHGKDQQLCLVTCLCQSDCDSDSFDSSSGGSSSSSSSSSSRDGIWVRVAEEDACMDSFIIDHLTSLRDKIQCEKYEMMMMTTNNGVDGVDDSCNNSDDNGGSGGQYYNCPPIVMWSTRSIPANSHQARRSVVIVMIIYHTLAIFLSIITRYFIYLSVC